MLPAPLSWRDIPKAPSRGLPSEGLARFVERELREFLTCGVLAEPRMQQTVKQNREPETENLK